MDSIKNKLFHHPNPEPKESQTSTQSIEGGEPQEPNKSFEFKKELASEETGKVHAGTHAGDASAKHGEAGKDGGEEQEGKKGNWFSRMVATQKERTQKELRAEEAASLRRERAIQGGGPDGMLKREF